MADYFTHLAVLFADLRPEELEWWTDVSTALDDVDDLDELKEDAAVHAEFVRLFGAETSDLFATEGGRVGDIHVVPAKRTVLITDSGGSANVDHIARVIQAYLRTFRCGDPAVFEYAATCSASRPDGFGGGWVAVTQDTIEVHDTRQIVLNYIVQSGGSEDAHANKLSSD